MAKTAKDLLDRLDQELLILAHGSVQLDELEEKRGRQTWEAKKNENTDFIVTFYANRKDGKPNDNEWN